MGRINESVVDAQDRITEICNNTRTEAKEIEKKINKKIGDFCNREFSRIYDVVKLLNTNLYRAGPDKQRELMLKARRALFISQRYSLSAPLKEDSLEGLDLIVKNDASLEYIDIEERKPMDVSISLGDNGEVSLSFTLFDDNEKDALKGLDLSLKIILVVWKKGKSEETTGKTFTEAYKLGNDEPISFDISLLINTSYCFKVKVEYSGLFTKWSDVAEFVTPGFNRLCVWDKCPEYVDGSKTYSVDEKYSKIATNAGNGLSLSLEMCFFLLTKLLHGASRY